MVFLVCVELGVYGAMLWLSHCVAHTLIGRCVANHLDKEEQMGLIAYIAERSKNNAGKPLYPHRHKDGKYVASHTRFEADYV